MIEPYYEHGGITIYHGDCREVLPSLSGVGCVVTSPPYNQRINSFVGSGFKKGGRWAGRIASSYFDDMPEDDLRTKCRACRRFGVIYDTYRREFLKDFK